MVVDGFTNIDYLLLQCCSLTIWTKVYLELSSVLLIFNLKEMFIVIAVTMVA